MMLRPETSEYDSKTLLALDRQAALVKGAFHDAGYESVEPPVLQPAEVFLNRSGEDIRRRIFVFTDPAGEEVCLRPDLTIPVCRMYLAQNPEAKGTAKFCYNGTAFRYQPDDPTKPREFLQAGIESLGARDRDKADADVLALISNACAQAGLKSAHTMIGDVGLFFALIDALDIPDQWRLRLHRAIWQPDEFQALLQRYAGKANEHKTANHSGLLTALSQLDEAEAHDVLADVLDLAQISPVGGRSVEEITQRLLQQAAETRADALSPATVKLINDYLKVKAKPRDALAKIRKLTGRARLKLDKALDSFERRLELLDERGLATDAMTFDADFGRNMEYYTGFVFELSVPKLGQHSQVAGGGRYDMLLRELGAPRVIPAVGGMIRTERLLVATGNGGAK